MTKQVLIKKISRGFTLVELLVYMALMSIFLLVLLDIFTTTLNFKLSSESSSAISQDASYVLAKLSYDINNAESITTPAPGVTGSTLQLVTGGVSSTFSLSNGNLVKTIGGVSMSLNSLDTGFDSITFKNIGNAGGKPTVQIVFTIRGNIILAGGGTETKVINTTVGVR